MASPFAITGDNLIDLQMKLNSSYRSGAVFAFNSITAGAVRKLKGTTTGDYLWQPGLQAGAPNTLLGSPVEIWEGMDDVGAAKFPVAYGNFRRAYLLVESEGMRITRDNVTNIGFVKFYVRRREGGIVMNNDALKFIRTGVVRSGGQPWWAARPFASREEVSHGNNRESVGHVRNKFESLYCGPNKIQREAKEFKELKAHHHHRK